MSNVAISEILGHMELMKNRIREHARHAEQSIERRVTERNNADESIRRSKIELADYHAANIWLDAEIDRIGRS